MKYTADNSPEMFRPKNFKAIALVFGQSGSGKSTFSEVLCSTLRANGRRGVWLNGDYIRRTAISADLGFTDEDRIKQAARVGSMASCILNCSDVDYVIVDLVAPLKEARSVFWEQACGMQSILTKRDSGSIAQEPSSLYGIRELRAVSVFMEHLDSANQFSTSFQKPEGEKDGLGEDALSRVQWEGALSYDDFVRKSAAVVRQLLPGVLA